jgi:hypothetical protein
MNQNGSMDRLGANGLVNKGSSFMQKQRRASTDPLANVFKSMANKSQHAVPWRQDK